jgi:hypothetical protein
MKSTVRAIAAVTLAAFFMSGASAHDQWANGTWVSPKLKDPITQRLCCGENDCFPMEEDQVRIERQGYRLLDTNELIPFERAQPSPDGLFWRCRWGAPKTTQCFFAPSNGS